MNVIKGLSAAVQGEPRAMMKLHLVLTLAWLVATPVIAILFATSVPFLVGISVYAVVTGHWAAWQAARVEVRQERQESA